MIIKNNLNKFVKISAVLLAGGVLASGNSFKNFGEIFNSNCIVANAIGSKEEGCKNLIKSLEIHRKLCELAYSFSVVLHTPQTDKEKLEKQIRDLASTYPEFQNLLLNLSVDDLLFIVNRIFILKEEYQNLKNIFSELDQETTKSANDMFKLLERYKKRFTEMIIDKTNIFQKCLKNSINNFGSCYGNFSQEELKNIKLSSFQIVRLNNTFYSNSITNEFISKNEKHNYEKEFNTHLDSLKKVFSNNQTQTKPSEGDSIISTAAIKNGSGNMLGSSEGNSIISTTAIKNGSGNMLGSSDVKKTQLSKQQQQKIATIKKKALLLAKILDKKDVSKGKKDVSQDKKDVSQDTKGIPKTSIDASSNLLGFTIGSGIIGISSLISILKIKRRKK